MRNRFFHQLPLLLFLNLWRESAHGLLIGRHSYPSMLSSPASPVVGDTMVVDKCTDQSRRIILLVIISNIVLLAPKHALSLPEDLDSINWSKPKARFLNTERMADGINDSIKESRWLVTGLGQQEYFSDSFVFQSEGETKISIAGYEQYCRWVHNRFRSSACCDLICCSVTAPNTITALWRFADTRGHSDISYVVLSVFKTSDEDDGLVVSQLEKVIINSNAPSSDDLCAKCNWYSCTLEKI